MYICIYIYIYIYANIYIYIYIYWQKFFIDTYLMEHYRHFLSTYFFVNSFKLTYLSCDIWQEFVDKPSMIST